MVNFHNTPKNVLKHAKIDFQCGGLAARVVDVCGACKPDDLRALPEPNYGRPTIWVRRRSGFAGGADPNARDLWLRESRVALFWASFILKRGAAWRDDRSMVILYSSRAEERIAVSEGGPIFFRLRVRINEDILAQRNVRRGPLGFAETSGGGAPSFIAYSQNGALKAASTPPGPPIQAR